MIATSENYKQAVKENRQFLCKTRVKLRDDTELNFKNENIFSSGFSFDEAVSGSGSFDIGAAIIGKFKLMINNIDGEYDNCDFEEAVLYPQVGLQLLDKTEMFNRGVYTVDEVTSSGGVIVISALDNLSKFEKDYDTSLVYPASLRDIVYDACMKCGVPLLSTTFDNASYIIENRPAECTYLDIISYAAQVSGCFAKCNKDGYLELKWYDINVFESDVLNPNTYHKISKLTSQKISALPVVITGIKVTETNTEARDTVSYLYGEDGYVLSIPSNPFIQAGQGETIARFLGNKIIGMQFYPLSVNALSDPAIEAGDLAVVTDTKGREYQCYLTSISFTVGAIETFTCDAKTPSKNKAVSKSALTKAIIQARQDAENDFSNYEKTVEQMTELLGNSLGYYVTTEYDENGGLITYMHDMPELLQSRIIWKKTINAFGVSVDGGLTFSSGITADGNAIVQMLTAHGIDAEWLITGTIRSKTGNSYWNLETGEMRIAGDQAELLEEISTNATTDLKTLYYKSTSPTALTGGTWQETAPTWTNGTYIWLKTVTTKADGTVSESNPVCITGNTGTSGDKGTAAYVHIKYSANADGTGFSDIPNAYMGVYSGESETAPTNKAPYKWTKVTGADGKSVYCKIAATSNAFNSDDGGDTFAPSEILLFPNFQGCNFNVWQYSVDGSTWATVISGQNNLTINTDNSLKIDYSSDLFSASGTVVFRLQSDVAGVEDTTTILRNINIVNLKDQLEEMAANGEINKTSIHDISSSLQLLQDSLNATIIDTWVSYYGDDFTALQQQIATILATINEFSVTFTEIESFQSSYAELMGEEISKYMRFSSAGQLIIGRTDSLYQTMIDNDSFNIMSGGNVVATFSQDGLETQNGYFHNSIRIGNILYQAYANGVAHIWGGD